MFLNFDLICNFPKTYGWLMNPVIWAIFLVSLSMLINFHWKLIGNIYNWTNKYLHFLVYFCFVFWFFEMIHYLVFYCYKYCCWSNKVIMWWEQRKVRLKGRTILMFLQNEHFHFLWLFYDSVYKCRHIIASFTQRWHTVWTWLFSVNYNISPNLERILILTTLTSALHFKQMWTSRKKTLLWCSSLLFFFFQTDLYFKK